MGTILIIGSCLSKYQLSYGTSRVRSECRKARRCEYELNMTTAYFQTPSWWVTLSFMCTTPSTWTTWTSAVILSSFFTLSRPVSYSGPAETAWRWQRRRNSSALGVQQCSDAQMVQIGAKSKLRNQKSLCRSFA